MTAFQKETKEKEIQAPGGKGAAAPSVELLVPEAHLLQLWSGQWGVGKAPSKKIRKHLIRTPVFSGSRAQRRWWGREKKQEGYNPNTA